MTTTHSPATVFQPYARLDFLRFIVRVWEERPAVYPRYDQQSRIIGYCDHIEYNKDNPSTKEPAPEKVKIQRILGYGSTAKLAEDMAKGKV